MTKESAFHESAVHEAGHAVANFEYGQPFLHVELMEDGSGEVDCGGVIQIANLKEAEPFAVCLFAGYAAEHVILGDQLTVEGGDWDRYRQHVMPHFRSNERFDWFTDKMLAKSVRLMKRHRETVQAVASALNTNRRMTEEEIALVIKNQRESRLVKYNVQIVKKGDTSR